MVAARVGDAVSVSPLVRLRRPMQELHRLPKVVLHDHLDGGVRPETMIDLAPTVGYRDLPSTDPAVLAAALFQGEASSLEDYLDAFRHTFGVMQTPEAMHRVAYECIADHAAEGVVYAEIRFAPSLHLRAGMTRGEAIAAVVAGLTEVAEAAIAHAGHGVVAIDLAGPEAGYPAPLHEQAIAAARDGGLRVTIHAGEGAGVDSIAGALAVGAERLGHGARIVEDTEVVDREIVAMGPVAAEVHERGIPLELCPTSNLHTKMYPSLRDHPIGALHRAGFQVTVNTDNRLMSRITMTDEFRVLTDEQGFSLADLRSVTLNALDAAFCSDEVRDSLRARIEAGYER